MLYNIILVLFVLVAVALIALILIQQGKGADAGAAFGSGASGTVFGARGAASFLTRTTGVLATLFFVFSLTLAYLSTQQRKPDSVIDNLPKQSTPQKIAPDVPAAGGTDAASKSPAPADTPDMPGSK